MGIETFREKGLAEILSDKEFMRNFKNKTEMYNTAVKRLYNFSKDKPAEVKEAPKIPTYRVKIHG